MRSLFAVSVTTAVLLCCANVLGGPVSKEDATRIFQKYTEEQLQKQKLIVAAEARKTLDAKIAETVKKEEGDTINDERLTIGKTNIEHFAVEAKKIADTHETHTLGVETLKGIIDKLCPIFPVCR